MGEVTCNKQRSAPTPSIARSLIACGEMIWSRWNVPFAVTPEQGDTVSSLGASRTVSVLAALVRRGARRSPGVLGDYRTAFGGRPTTWDAPVLRYEAGGGFFIRRNIVARGTVQWNRRDSSRARSRTFLSGQVSYWF